jgi:hypothetical protein
LPPDAPWCGGMQMYPISRGVLLLAWLLASGLVPYTVTPEPRSTPATGTPSIRYDRGLLDVRAEAVPLGRVLHELVRQGVVQVSFTDPVLAHWPVSVAVAGLPVVEGIKEILAGLSYAISRGADTWRVIVLSPPPDPASAGSTTAGQARQRSGEGVLPVLDVFQSTAGEDESFDERAEVIQQEDPSPQFAQQQEHQEALLHHTLAVLRSENSLLHAAALEHLVGMDDPRATHALVEVASTSSPAADVQVRVQAVSALWRHAADLQFRDEVSANALQQLAADSDSQVAQVARRAVASMEQYQQQPAH